MKRRFFGAAAALLASASLALADGVVPEPLGSDGSGAVTSSGSLACGLGLLADAAVWSDTAVWSSSILQCAAALFGETAQLADAAVWSNEVPSDQVVLNDAAVWSNTEVVSASITGD